MLQTCGNRLKRFGYPNRFFPYLNTVGVEEAVSKVNLPRRYCRIFVGNSRRFPSGRLPFMRILLLLRMGYMAGMLRDWQEGVFVVLQECEYDMHPCRRLAA